MKLNFKPVEEWTSNDFLKYIALLLRNLGHDYKIQYPQDAIIVGSLLKQYHAAGKSMIFVKEQIDGIFHDNVFNTVHSLLFLRTFLKPQRLMYQHEKYSPLKDDSTHIRPCVTRKLIGIKKDTIAQ